MRRFEVFFCFFFPFVFFPVAYSCSRGKVGSTRIRADVDDTKVNLAAVGCRELADSVVEEGRKEGRRGREVVRRVSRWK